MNKEEQLELELDILKEIAKDSSYDDANLHGERQKAATRLWRKGLIKAYNVEGSDAPVEALRLSEKGKAFLTQKQDICEVCLQETEMLDCPLTIEEQNNCIRLR